MRPSLLPRTSPSPNEANTTPATETKTVGVVGGGPAQGARRPQLCEDGGLGRDRTRHHAGGW